MPDLNALVLFAKIVEVGSFSEAARILNLPKSTVSRRISDLENALGLRLLERSTRKLHLTDVGAELLSQAQKSAEIEDAIKAIVSQKTTDISGTLRIAAPPNIADSVLSPLIIAFQASHPNVRFQVMITDRYVDPISEGIDLGFRVGQLPNSSLIKQTILAYRHQLVASPDYIHNNAPILEPQDLINHRLLAFSFWGTSNEWVLGQNEKRVHIAIQPSLEMNDYAGLAVALEGGAGIGELPPIVLPHLIRDGKLLEILPTWHFPKQALSIVHLGKRHMRRPVRLFKDFAAQKAKELFPNLPT